MSDSTEAMTSVRERSPLQTNMVKIAAIVPCYKTKAQILSVLNGIGPECWRIYVIDDKCPEGTGEHVEANVSDPRVTVIYNAENIGVGGAVIEGYKKAIADGATILVKIDGDGQMDPKLIKQFAQPIIEGHADYTKGNRFYDLDSITKMPGIRILGNAVLSFMTKLSSGYWDLFDPTNGYTAIHASVVAMLPLEKISRRYFFESDILFRLNTIRAVVVDIPMRPVYGSEVSNLDIQKAMLEFLKKHAANTFKRIFYNYYLRNFSLASIELFVGVVSITFGTIFGAISWAESSATGNEASAGTVMLAALPIMLGIQFVIAFFSYDIGAIPRYPISKKCISIADNDARS